MEIQPEFGLERKYAMFGLRHKLESTYLTLHFLLRPRQILRIAWLASEVVEFAGAAMPDGTCTVDSKNLKALSDALPDIIMVEWQ